ncbi:adenosine receptor A2a uORF5 [Rattus norvegicus]|uniref:adenosine receptor A2a uORF5 n=1 Tax=Rattus norvegicus TaxID=10116 RepID=UPI000C1B1618|nr:adenosine receptor A2a uORF5 [Rattus norvegicus]
MDRELAQACIPAEPAQVWLLPPWAPRCTSRWSWPSLCWPSWATCSCAGPCGSTVTCRTSPTSLWYRWRRLTLQWVCSPSPSLSPSAPASAPPATAASSSPVLSWSSRRVPSLASWLSPSTATSPSEFHSGTMAW